MFIVPVCLAFDLLTRSRQVWAADAPGFTLRIKPAAGG